VHFDSLFYRFDDVQQMNQEIYSLKVTSNTQPLDSFLILLYINVRRRRYVCL
jgi:hypothetical protein